ncbi:MAG: ABC transporter permease subunit [Xanthomonadaceae bacterium]|nr:ABC transporter permease subunit [Xanthomonadaceae bacterium]
MIAHIAWREFRNLFLSPLAWCVLAVVQFLLAFIFLAQLENFQLVQSRLLAMEGAPGVTDLVATPVLTSATTLLLLVVPLLTMRMFAEERRSGTLRLLISAPVSLYQVVLGKYLGLVGLLLVMVGMLLLMPLSLVLGTSLDWGKLAAAALGLTLMISAFAAAGLFMSTLTVQPVVAAVSSFGLLLLLWIIDWAGAINQQFSEVFSYLSLLRHYESMVQGVFSSADLAYYLLFIVAFLGLAVRRLDAERLQR